MVSMQNLTAKDLVSIAKQLYKNDMETVAVLVTTSEYIQGKGERVISQAIIPCKEVED